ncbi:MAG: DNA polymerase III subunit delta [Solirubrobacterales bacterium]
MASDQLKSAYLVAGTDTGKIDEVVARLRSRAGAEGGLETFEAQSTGGPDAAALLAALPAMTLIAGRRFLLADGVERWTAKQATPVAEALTALPPDVTVVLVAREEPPKVRAPKALAAGVEKAGGDVLEFAAPKARQLPAWLDAEARRRGIAIDHDAAQLLVERMGESTVRLGSELDRLATWAGDGGVVEREDLEAMIADTSEEVAWALTDALLDRSAAGAVAAAERLTGQGEAVTPLIYAAAKRLREAHRALAALDEGRSPKEVESSLGMHPYAAKMLVQRVRGGNRDEIAAATCAVADLEWWTRGGSDYPEEVALTLAMRRAAGARN